MLSPWIFQRANSLEGRLRRKDNFISNHNHLIFISSSFLFLFIFKPDLQIPFSNWMPRNCRGHYFHGNSVFPIGKGYAVCVPAHSNPCGSISWTRHVNGARIQPCQLSPLFHSWRLGGAFIKIKKYFTVMHFWCGSALCRTGTRQLLSGWSMLFCVLHILICGGWANITVAWLFFLFFFSFGVICFFPSWEHLLARLCPDSCWPGLLKSVLRIKFP